MTIRDTYLSNINNLYKIYRTVDLGDVNIHLFIKDYVITKYENEDINHRFATALRRKLANG